MGVPTSGSFKMFDTGSSENAVDSSILGAQLYDALDIIPGNERGNFNSSKNNARLSRFHPSHLGPNIDSISQVVSASQFRGYPVKLQDISCFSSSFQEIDFPILNCITWQVYKLDNLATGSIQYSSAPTASSITSCTNNGNTLYGIIVTSSNTEFVGWSLTQDENNIESTNPIYGYTMGDDDYKIYAIIQSSNAIALDMCYYSTSTGQTDRCTYCSSTRKVYFDRDTYLTSSLDDLIWYNNQDLTTFAPNGYYRSYEERTTSFGFTRKYIDNINYLITGSDGDAHAHSVCEGDFIYCT